MLQELKKYYELYIFSQGDQEYVGHIMEILDPDQYIFLYYHHHYFLSFFIILIV